MDHETDDENTRQIVDILMMRKPRWAQDDAGSSTAWLISFTDVIALMLTFFVLLYAMSDPVQQKWDYKIGLTPDAVAEYGGDNQQAGVNEGRNISRVDYYQAKKLDYLEAVLKEILEQEGGESLFVITRYGTDLRLAVNHEGFDGNDKKTDMIVRRLAAAFNNFDNRIVIAGGIGIGENARAFAAARQIGELLAGAGYKKPLALAFDSTRANDPSVLHILIQPHDGRRIIR